MIIDLRPNQRCYKRPGVYQPPEITRERADLDPAQGIVWVAAITLTVMAVIAAWVL